ncbi:ATP-dependent helicase [Nannocystis punicea]|uniref:DNA 3'-5' helicase n=1 Tax=Nannocystis punicea TaxID=2995304 RepID=A0ABY7HC48_9BACT|nr:ATP-dependent helicase [Nannocystis poenicansa]WAS96839.1 ATP-dependent helicase [Nannocystis poenicansa]
MKYVLKSSAPTRQPFDLGRELNAQQLAVVEADPGEILVLAGAGTGKTRTLTYRVARLVAGGCQPERILLCTFTNRAAREMVGRVESLLGVEMRRCSAGTFHHVGNRILRRYGAAIGLSPDFGILDPEDARTLLGAVVAEFGLQTLTARRFPQAKVLANLISLAANTRKPLMQVVEEHGLRLLDQAVMIDEVALRFAERKRHMNVCDFDDLLIHWLRLLEDPRLTEVAALVRSAYDHVLVDEYQDVSAIQGALVDAMAKEHGSLVCVGDDAQSIYGFRGADFAQIAEFRARHPGARLYPLTINYRSTPEVLALANRSIARNVKQYPKELVAVKKSGPKPAVIPLRDVFQQAEFIAQRVLELHHEYDLPLSRMAVLYRNHSHSLELQVELTRRQIPYTVRSGLRFFEQAHIKDVVAYLRARQNPQDSLSWIRLLRLWPGIGAQTAEQLAVLLAKETAAGAASSAQLLAEQAGQARGRGRPALERLAELWAILENPDLRSPGAMIREVVARHYGEYTERNFPNAAARKDDLEHLAGYAERYDGANEFLSELALVQGMSAENVLGAEEPDDMLVLSTVHQAKGLEWPICFVLWLAEGRFPMATSVRDPADLEEERRLFYVAATRAADELYCCYPVIEESRDGPSHIMRPSRFLVEIDHNPAVFERWQIEEAPATG